MKTRSLAPGAYLARSGQGVSLYDADGKCFAMNKMGGSILALALTGLSAEGIADALRHYFNGTPTQSRDEVAAWLDEMEASGWPPTLLPHVGHCSKVCRILRLGEPCTPFQSLQALPIAKSCTNGAPRLSLSQNLAQKSPNG